MFQAIAERQCTRGEYDARPLQNEELGLLQRAGSAGGVQVLLLTERAAMEKVLEYVVQGNTVQMSDPAFVEELKTWIRYSSQDAVRTGDGLYGASSGNSSLPSWLGSALFRLFFTPKTENDKYAKQVRSSAGIAVFVGDNANKAHWVEVGTLLRAIRLAGDCAGYPQRVHQSTGRGSDLATAICEPSRPGQPSTGPCRALWPRPQAAPIVAETRASGTRVTRRDALRWQDLEPVRN